MRFVSHFQKTTGRKFLLGGAVLAIFLGVISIMLVCLAVWPNPFQSPIQRAYLQWFPGDKSGSLVLFQSLNTLAQSNFFQFDSTMSAELLSTGQPVAQVNLSIGAPLQWQNPAGTPFRQDLQLSAELMMPGNTLKTDTDLKLTNENFYFKFNTVPTQLNLNLEQMLGQWYQVPLPASGSAVVPTSAADQQKLSQAFVQLWQQGTIGPALSQMRQGKSVYVVAIALPQTAVQTYLNRVLRIESQTRPDQKPEITQAWQNWLVQAFAPLSTLHGEILIDQHTLQPIHFDGSLVYLNNQPKKPNNRTGLLAILSDINQANFQFQIDLSQFNQTPSFHEPTDALPVNQLFTDALSKLQSGRAQSGVGTAELPTLTPYQQQQLQQMNSITPAQKQHFLDQLDKIGHLSTASASQP